MASRPRQSRGAVIGLAICVLLTAAGARESAATDRPAVWTMTGYALEASIRQRFKAAWEARSAEPAERPEVALKLYRDVWLWPPTYDRLPQWPASVPENATADDILAGKYGILGLPMLWEKANDICLDFFTEQAEAVLPSMVEEVRAFEGGPCTALDVLSEMRRHCYLKGAVWHQDGSFSLDAKVRRAWDSLVEKLYPVISERFLQCGKGDENRASRLAGGIAELGDPRGIPLLLDEDGENRILAYSNEIILLQEGQKARPEVLKLLSSENTQVRRLAASALIESRDPALVEPVVKLLQDQDPRVRECALWILHRLPAEARSRTREARRPLLEDPDQRVRVRCAWCFARDKDAVCGPALLRLLREEDLPMEFRGEAVYAMECLAGSRFGYRLDSDAWQPSTENNKAAIAKFEEWMRQHPPAAS